MTMELISKKPMQIVADGRGVRLNSLEEVIKFCEILIQSNKLSPKDFNTPQAVFVAVQAGLELGLSPMQSVQDIAVINGRPSIWGDAAWALVKSHPECEETEETFEGAGEELVAICTIKRRKDNPVVRRFGYKDAKRAGLWGKAGPWTQYPKRMLQMRARSWAMRDSFPDALKGIRIAEEWRDVRIDGKRSVEKAELKPSKELIFPDEDSVTLSQSNLAQEKDEICAQDERNEEGEYSF